MTSAGAVVVHHRRFPAVLDTVADLLAGGIPPAALVVVDNSEDPAVTAALEDAAGGWSVRTVPNAGYGAAANAGVRALPPTDVVLVVTHEVRIDAASVGLLVGAAARPGVAAAGPGRLLDDRGAVWSRGGALTPRFRRPRQVVDDDPAADGVRDVDWLDGACVAYDRAVVAEHPFREDFFMYFEETELHARLRAAGGRVVAVDGATASQSTGGMPAYWGCRNVVLFQQAHGRAGYRWVAPVGYLARQVVLALGRGDVRDAARAPRGLLDGYRAARSRR